MTTNKFRVRLILAAAFSAILILVAVLACKSSEAETVGDVLDPSQSEGSVQVLEPNGSFTVDDVVAAGWKKSKELSAETLPDATSV